MDASYHIVLHMPHDKMENICYLFSYEKISLLRNEIYKNQIIIYYVNFFLYGMTICVLHGMTILPNFHK